MTEYRNIMIHALVKMGDLIMATSAVALLKKAYPLARITMLVRPEMREVVNNNPLINNVMVFEPQPRKKKLRYILRLAREIKDRHFDISISLDHQMQTALLMYLAGIPIRVGTDRGLDGTVNHAGWFYTETIPLPADMTHQLQVETYQDIIRAYTGIKDEAHPVFAKIYSDNIHRAENLLTMLPSAKQYVALCVKGTSTLRNWPKRYFIQVVTELSLKYDAAFYIIGTEEDRRYADNLIATMPVPVANFCGQTSLRDLAALFRLADLFITVDSGAAHIAATTGIPMIALYGCTDPVRWRPYNENAAVFTSHEPCCPCGNREICPVDKDKPPCLWNVKPEPVIRKSMEILDEALSMEQ